MDSVECLKSLLGPGKDSEALMQPAACAGMQTSEHISEEGTFRLQNLSINETEHLVTMAAGPFWYIRDLFFI